MLITVQHQVIHSLDAGSMAALKAAIAINGETKIMLAETLAGINRLLKGETIMIQEITDLKAQVRENTTVIGSAKALIDGFGARLDAAIALGNPADVKAAAIELRAEIKANDDALAASVAANTPATPPAQP